jgi:hypothetical protein
LNHTKDGRTRGVGITHLFGKKMKTTLAMAGLAEAGEYYSILLWRGMIGIAVILALWGFVRRSRTKAWFALGIISITVAVVQPWWDFAKQPPPADPDAVYWLAQWRVLSMTLIGGFIFSVALVIGTLCRGQKKGPNQPLQGTPGKVPPPAAEPGIRRP